MPIPGDCFPCPRKNMQLVSVAPATRDGGSPPRAGVSDDLRQKLAWDDPREHPSADLRTLALLGGTRRYARAASAHASRPEPGVSCVGVRAETPASVEGAASRFARLVSAAARIRPTQQRAGAPSGASGLLLCQEAGVSPCAPGRRPERAPSEPPRRRLLSRRRSTLRIRPFARAAVASGEVVHAW